MSEFLKRAFSKVWSSVDSDTDGSSPRKRQRTEDTTTVGEENQETAENSQHEDNIPSSQSLESSREATPFTQPPQRDSIEPEPRQKRRRRSRIKMPNLDHLELATFNIPPESDGTNLDDLVIEYFKSADFSKNKAFFHPDEFEHAIWSYNVINGNTQTFRKSYGLHEMGQNTRVSMYCQDRDCEFGFLCRLHQETVNRPAPLYVITAENDHSPQCKGVRHGEALGMNKQLPADFDELDWRVRANIRKCRVRQQKEADAQYEKAMKKYNREMKAWDGTGKAPEKPVEQTIPLPENEFIKEEYERRILTSKRVQYLFRMIPDQLTVSKKRKVLLELLCKMFPCYDRDYCHQMEVKGLREYYQFGIDKETDNFGGIFVMAAYIKAFNEENGVVVFTDVNGVGSKIVDLDSDQVKKTKNKDLARNLVASAYEDCILEEIAENGRLATVIQPADVLYKLESYEQSLIKTGYSPKKMKNVVKKMLPQLAFQTLMERAEIEKRYKSFDELPPIDDNCDESMAQLPLIHIQQLPDNRLPTSLASNGFDYSKMFEFKTGFTPGSMERWAEYMRHYKNKATLGIFIATSSMKRSAPALRNQWYLSAEPGNCPKSQLKYSIYLCYAYDGNGNRNILAFAILPPESQATWTIFLKALKAHYELGGKTMCNRANHGIMTALERELPDNRQKYCYYHVERAIGSEQCSQGLRPRCWRADPKCRAAREAFLRMIWHPSSQNVQNAREQLKSGVITSKFMENPERFALDKEMGLCDMKDNVLDEQIRSLPLIGLCMRLCDDQLAELRSNFDDQAKEYLVQLTSDCVLTSRASTILRQNIKRVDNVDGGPIPNLESRSCSCGRYQEYGVPCEHALNLINVKDLGEIAKYIESWNNMKVVKPIVAEATKTRSFAYMDFEFGLTVIGGLMHGCIGYPPQWTIQRHPGAPLKIKHTKKRSLNAKI